ncbi:MAG: cellulase family glycosylhydrolase [Ruminococcus sp.]|jgi:aryl-phospho-beta-D-glucosidase BglC (GH1 family)|nr:cellulase family glycosylhydrolase [Ruminococcus sp.]
MKKFISTTLVIFLCMVMLSCTEKTPITDISAISVSTTTKAVSLSSVSVTKADTPESDILTVSVNSPNSWEEGGNPISQFEVTIHNNSKNTVNGWEVTLKMGTKAVLKDNWNAKIAIKNGVLSADPMDYNLTIEPGMNVSFGMIITNPGEIKEKSAKANKTSTGSSNSSGNSGNSGNDGNTDNSAAATPPPAPALNLDVPPPTTDDWLFTKGNKIVDKDGNEVWLTGVNWFGYNTGTNTFDGLWSADLNSSIASIADHGFNLLRIPFSVELIKDWSEGEYPQANFNQATNSYLVGMNSLEIFDYVVSQCRANGMKIMIDIHSAATDSMGHMDADWLSANITEKDFLSALAWMANRYKNDDTIIAYDLKNEPHGKANENPRVKWDDSSDADNWRYVAEKAALAVLKKNPNVLIMVEGIEIYPKNIKKNGDFSSTNSSDYYGAWWGGNLRGVADNPVDLGKYNNKLVYSPHDYGPSVYAQTWFQGDYTYKSVMDDYWYDSWFYIHKENIAPLLIGEWGGFMTEPNLKWMTLMRRLIKENRIHHTFWCFNANSGDTGGLVSHDFTTWDDEKYNFVKEVLWQKDGKFVGLDRKIPLGKNGITLTDAVS